MTPREIIADIFLEEISFDTCEEAADLMLAKLAEHGLRIVPFKPTKEMKAAWRAIQKAEQTLGPVKTWQSMLTAVD